MGIEIERKFLVDDATALWLIGFSCKKEIIKQGYITDMLNETQVRVRTTVSYQPENQCLGFVTIKSGNCDMVRKEYEFDIPYNQANFMMQDLCSDRLIHKNRYHISKNEMLINLPFTLDVFKDRHEGLLMVEVEYDDILQSTNDKPSWVLKEVTNDLRYYNVNLARNSVPINVERSDE